MVELVESYHHYGVRHVEIIFDLLLSAQRVHHVCYCSDKVYSVKHVDRLRTVRHGYRDSVVFADSEDPERLCAEIDLVHQIFICDVLAHEVESYIERMLLRCLLDLLVHGSVEVFDSKRQVAPASVPWYLHGFRHREYNVSVFIYSPVI